MEEHLQRLQKQVDMKERGIPAYPNDFRPSHTAGDLIAQFGSAKAEELEKVETVFRVAGRLVALRSFGKARFGHLLNRDQKIQIYLKKDAMGEEAFEITRFLDVGDWVGVEGRIFRTRTGELTIAVSRLRILSKCVRPLPEKWHGLTDVETRFRQRYVDLIVNPEARRIVTARQSILNGLRSFLLARGFVEVDTPMMQAMAGGAAARPFVTHHNALDMKLHMRIAPELYLKRLLVGGIERVFEIGRNFRNEGLSTQHNPEFTMLEFYQSFAGYEDLMDLTEEMLSGLAKEVCGSYKIPYGEHEIDLSPPWRRLTMVESLVEIGGIDRGAVSDAAALRAMAVERGVKPEEGPIGTLGIGGLQMAFFEEAVEPKLIQPTFITQYPVEVSPLARRNEVRPELVDRFELFIAGREMANAFSELNDPADQRKRFEEQLAQKKGEEREWSAVDEDYVQALEFGMPPAAGEGIGVDRLAMLLTNASSIREVILFPLMRPLKERVE